MFTLETAAALRDSGTVSSFALEAKPWILTVSTEGEECVIVIFDANVLGIYGLVTLPRVSPAERIIRGHG